MANTGFGFIPVLDTPTPEESAGTGYQPLFSEVEGIKLASIDTLVARKQRNLEESWVGKLGMNPESVPAQALNMAASVLSGGSRVAGNLATLGLDLTAGMATGSVPENVIEAFNRTQAGEGTDADQVLLNQVAPFDDGIPQTYAQRLQGAADLYQASQSVADFFDISSIVETSRRDRLSDELRDSTADGVADLRAAWAAAQEGNYRDAITTGAAGLADTVGNALATGVQSPAAVAEYVGENVPQLVAAAINPASMIATNAGYGFDAYREGITEYMNENEGQLPDAQDRREMAAFAASAALAEQLGDVSLLRGMRNSGRGVGAGVASVAGATTREGVTEGYQTYAESRAKLQEASAEEIIEGATIGALVGGNFQLAGAVGTRASGTAQTAAERIQAEQSANALYDQAISTGSVGDLARVDPVRAVNALGELSRDADQATVAANIAQADRIQQSLTQEISGIQSRLENYSEEGTNELRGILAELQASQGSEADIRALQTAIQTAERYTPAMRKADEANLAQLQTALTGVQEASTRLRVDTTPDTEALVEQVNTGVGAGDAVNRALTLTMINPDALSTTQLDALASNENLSPEQRDAFVKFSAAQQAENELKGISGVRSDVINGGRGFKGINQYRQAVRMALASGNQEAAQNQVASLAGFAESRISKADAIARAYEQVKGTQNTIHILPDANGVWMPVTGMSAKQVRDAGGLVVAGNSFRLRDEVAMEARVLARTAEALQAMVTANPQPVEMVAPTVAPSDAVGEATETAPVDATVQETTEPELQPTSPEPVSEAQTETQEAVADPVVETGELTALRNRTGEPVTSANYQQVNLLGELFTQEQGAEQDASQRPLVAVPNFATAVRSGQVRVADFLAQTDLVTGQQRAAINNFFGFARLMNGHIEAGYTRLRQADFRFQDYSQFLINEDGSVDENAKTAQAFGMFTWLSENANNLYNTDEAINMILNKESDDEVSPEAYRVLGKIGTREDVVANQLGARIVQALGIRPRPEAAANELARLETALGIQAIGAMARAGLIKRSEVSDATIQRLMNSQDAPSKAVHTFITINTEQVNGREVANQVVRNIREATVGSQSVLNKLFSVEAAGTEPSYEPVPFDQKYAKRTNRPISEYQAKVLEKEGAKKHFIRQDMHHVLGKLTRDELYTIAGVVNTTDTPIHARNKASQDAKNAGLMAQVDNYLDFAERTITQRPEGIEQPLYFGRSVWMPQRVGLNTNIINPQTSKVHRHLLAMEGWETEVDSNDITQLNNFKLRVMESFGKKTESKATELVLKDFDAMVAQPEIQAAVRELAKALRDEDIDSSMVVAGVQAAGEAFFSLDGLVALAHQQNAQDGKFKVTLMAEVDGVTNGPMLSLLMLGAKGYDVLNQGGFFEVGQTTADGAALEQFNDYKGMGNLDLYEGTVSGTLALLGNDPRLASVQVITGELRTDEGNVTSKGRNVIKKPLTAMMFGSNTTTAVQGMADGFIDSIYSKMEDAAAARDEGQMRTILTAVNDLMGTAPKLNVGMGIEQAMLTELTATQEAQIKQAFYELLGQPTEESLKANYGLFMARRDVVNQTAQLAFRLYDAAYTSMIEEAEATSPNIARRNWSRTDKKTGKVTTGTQTLRTLNTTEMAAINQRLEGMQPILMTAMAKKSNQLEAGMNMSKSKRELDSTIPFSSEVYFGQPVPTYNEAGEVIERKQTEVNGLRSKQTDPGVAPFITGVHSTDSAIATQVYSSMNALNVHDALGVGLHEAHTVGQRLNAATYENLRDYSIPTEMVSTLERVLTGLNNLMQDEALAARIQPKLKTLAAEMAQKKMGTIQQRLEMIRMTAEAADTDKLTTMASMQAVGQYATDGGSYVVTDADRQAAQDALQALGTTYDEGALAAAITLDQLTTAQPLDLQAAKAKALSNQSVEKLAPATTLNTLDLVEQTPAVDQVREAMLVNNISLEAAKEVVNTVEAAEVVDAVNNLSKTKISAWGEIGVPLIQSNVELVRVLEGNALTAHDLVDSLLALNTDAFTDRLLKMIKKVVPASMPVNYVTTDTPADGALGVGVNKARGWYHQEMGSAAIYVKSPDFVESGITPEMLTHELVHAALANLVDQQTGKATPAGRAIQRLEDIRLKAAQLLDNNGELAAKYRNATGNVHELLAWGLTNEQFQKEVLLNVQVPAARSGLLDGLKAFIRSTVEMLFGGNTHVANTTGMAQLVANATGLFSEASKLRETRGVQTLMYEDAVNHVNAMTAREVFNALEDQSPRKLSELHSLQLQSLIGQVVEPLYGPYGAFKEAASANRAITPMDVYLKALSTGQAPFASNAMASPFNVTQQEGFVLESLQATIEEAMRNGSTVFIRQELSNLYQQARKDLSAQNFHVGDWASATPAEKDVAQQKYDFLFKPQIGSTNLSKHLSQFAAMGMASEEVKNVLTFATADNTQPLKSLPWASRLVELIRRVITRLTELHTKVQRGTQAGIALSTLVDQLVDIEAKRKKNLIEQRLSALDQVEMYVGNLTGNVRQKVEAIASSNFFKQSRSPIIRAAGSMAAAVAGERVEQILDHVQVVRDRAMKTKEGVVMGMINEMRGTHDGIRVATEMFKGAKHIEKERKDHIENTVSQVNDSFKDGGAYLTVADRAALTKVFLRTNASALSDALGFNGFMELYTDPAKMTAKRIELENQVAQLAPNDVGYLTSMTKDMAYHRVTGIAVSHNVMLNTGNIARMYGTTKVNSLANPDAVAKVLDQLATVYALSYVGSADKQLADQVVRTEANRIDNHNGIDMILKLHAGLQKRSAELLFKGQEALQTNGYVPDIFDNKIEMLLVDQQDLQKYLNAGYVVATGLQKDTTDPVKENRVMVKRYGSGQTAILTGSLSYTGMHRKGSTPDYQSINLLQGTQVSSAAFKQQIRTAKQPLIAELFNRDLTYTPVGKLGGHMVPVLAPDGRIADYRYMMTEANRDALLDRDNSMDQVLGTLSGQIVDKVSSAAQNTDVIRGLYDQYRAEYSKRPTSFALFGKDSTDPQLAELYRLLPESAKQEIRKTWKADNMYIPYNQLNLIVGYRKYSLTEPFAKPERDLTKRRGVVDVTTGKSIPGSEYLDRNWAEQLFVMLTRAIWGDKAALRVGQAEDVMQELVKEAKDILVVKNIVTLVGNMVSNLSLLAIEGVTPREMFESHAVAIKGAMDYRKDARRLMQVRQALEIGYTVEGQEALEAEAVELADRLARNPIKPLIDAGLMPTIVEDVEADDSQYSYKSRLQQRVEKYTSRVPKLLREAGKQVYMTHDTSVYKFLSQTTQLSDLVARYALYQHVINRQRDPLSKADALRVAEDSFVNYDLPSHRSIQFLNDTGIFMFTKYYMRIQKTIMRLVREKPLRLLAMVGLDHFFQGVQSVTESHWLNKIGNNPLNDGAFGFIGTLDELPAFKLL